MNVSVENYFISGCGRCPLGGTPQCKIHRWVEEMQLLRLLVLDTGLQETCKWGVPCYTFNDKNVLTISAFKDYCAISFFKGSLIDNFLHLLEKPGQHSQAARLLKFDGTPKIEQYHETIKSIVKAAIEIEKAGLKVEFKQTSEPIPGELEVRFQHDPMLRTAFESLTPGRQRGYCIYFSAPKQSKTRNARIDRCIEKILNGEGLHDKYSSKRK